MSTWADVAMRGEAGALEAASSLEERARFPDQAGVNAALMEALALRPGWLVLEVGSGSGVLCRQAARWGGAARTVVGLDAAARLGAVARDLSLRADVAGSVSFVGGHGEALPFSDGCFDVCFAARLLLHVRDPGAIVGEMVRVVGPGGHVVAMDCDLSTLRVDHTDRGLTERLLAWRLAGDGADNRSGSRLAGRLAQAGLVEVAEIRVRSEARDGATLLAHSLGRAAVHAREAGALSGSEYDTWTREIDERLAGGEFRASVEYFIAVGARVARGLTDGR